MILGVVAKGVLRRFSTASPLAKVTLPDLKYSYSALEPVISSKLLEIHHKKHHQAYVNNLNNAIDQFEGKFLFYLEAKANFDYNKMVALAQTIKFNLGGHVNHSIYWENLAPIGQGGGEFPGETSALTKQVVHQYGSY